MKASLIMRRATSPLDESTRGLSHPQSSHSPHGRCIGLGPVRHKRRVGQVKFPDAVVQLCESDDDSWKLPKFADQHR